MVNGYIEWCKNNINGKIFEFKQAKINIASNEYVFGLYVINKTIVSLVYNLYYVYKDENEIIKKSLIGSRPTIYSIFKLLYKMNEKVISHGDIIICSSNDNWVIYDEHNGVVLEYSTTSLHERKPTQLIYEQYPRKPIFTETPILEFLKRERIIHTCTRLNPNDYLSNTDVINRARDHFNITNEICKQFSNYRRFNQYFTTYCKIGKCEQPGFLNSMISILSVIVITYIAIIVVVLGASAIIVSTFLTIEYFYKKVISLLPFGVSNKLRFFLK